MPVLCAASTSTGQVELLKHGSNLWSCGGYVGLIKCMWVSKSTKRQSETVEMRAVLMLYRL